MPDEIEATPAQRIAAANRQIRSERLASANRSVAEARTRQQLAVIDELIALLEERNLEGERRIDRGVRKWLRRLEVEIGVPVPRRVLRARNTARLHGALLDWMEIVLDEVVPARRHLGDDLDPE